MQQNHYRNWSFDALVKTVFFIRPWESCQMVKSFAKPLLQFILEKAMCQKFCAIIHQLTATTFDKEPLKKLPAKFWFENLLQLYFIRII